MKNVPICRVDRLQTLYSAARSKPGCDVMEVKTGGNLLKVADSVEKQYSLLHNRVANTST